MRKHNDLKKSLNLHTTTIRNLDNQTLAAVAGGGSDRIRCPSVGCTDHFACGGGGVYNM